MQLHGDAQTVVGLSDGEHQYSLVAFDLCLGQGFTGRAMMDDQLNDTPYLKGTGTLTEP